MKEQENLTDEYYMKKALRLARRGLGKTSPNPMVGAVIVKDGHVIGKGYHQRFGGNHAEINAIQDASENLSGATIYVTLEPCCHYGKTPPCVDAVIKNGFSRVVIGNRDPNPLVSGKSIEKLKQRGIEITTGVLEEDCRQLNEAFFKHITTGIPLVTLKYAQTLDGRIATTTGSSQWISSPKFLKRAHQLRAANDAIMVGINTLLADDSELTVRLARGRNPARIVLDSRLRIPLDAKIIRTLDAAPVIVATTNLADADKATLLREKGVEVLITGRDKSGGIDLRELLKVMGQRGIASVLVEGGASVITSLLQQKLVDKLVIAVAPKILGKGIEAIGDLNIRDISQAMPASFLKTYRLGEDLVIEADL